ncbi:NADH-quinone oxidoreductase subunit NuoK [Ilumatobacter sp.]|uniref:NADH-quinone oxidoreductase subunit NuoK n=1 Tax=Ilumatobacter sp. TaxID=1967498 RepID=UPI00375329E1
MNLMTVLLVASALIGVGVWGALAQQTFVMLMMGIEMMLNGVILATGAFWAFTGSGLPKGQVLVILTMAVMAVELAIGFALVAAVYRARQTDMTEGIGSLKG